MGMIDKGQEKLLARQKESILEEARNAGSTVEEVIDLNPEGISRGKVIGDSMKSFFGGKFRADAIQGGTGSGNITCHLRCATQIIDNSLNHLISK